MNTSAPICIQSYMNSAVKDGGSREGSKPPSKPNSTKQGGHNQTVAFDKEGPNRYSDEEGYLRGARIAEKIKEFQHTTKAIPKDQGPISSQSLSKHKQSYSSQPHTALIKGRAVSSYGYKNVGQGKDLLLQ